MDVSFVPETNVPLLKKTTEVINAHRLLGQAELEKIADRRLPAPLWTAIKELHDLVAELQRKLATSDKRAADDLALDRMYESLRGNARFKVSEREPDGTFRVSVNHD